MHLRAAALLVVGYAALLCAAAMSGPPAPRGQRERSPLVPRHPRGLGSPRHPLLPPKHSRPLGHKFTRVVVPRGHGKPVKALGPPKRPKYHRGGKPFRASKPDKDGSGALSTGFHPIHGHSAAAFGSPSTGPKGFTGHKGFSQHNEFTQHKAVPEHGFDHGLPYAHQLHYAAPPAVPFSYQVANLHNHAPAVG